jgi:hypothetical protein
MFKETALQIAIKEIGNGEQGENNSGPFVQKYLLGLVEPPTNWCAAFVCWCYYQAMGAPIYLLPPFPYTLSARKLMNELNKSDNIRIYVNKINPKRGDLIFFWRESPTSWMGHVGIIEYAGPKWIGTIEGNKGKFPSKVARYKYPADTLKIPKFLAFGHIDL